jgi:hypothetical protein
VSTRLRVRRERFLHIEDAIWRLVEEKPSATPTETAANHASD